MPTYVLTYDLVSPDNYDFYKGKEITSIIEDSDIIQTEIIKILNEYPNEVSNIKWRNHTTITFSYKEPILFDFEEKIKHFNIDYFLCQIKTSSDGKLYYRERSEQKTEIDNFNNKVKSLKKKS